MIVIKKPSFLFALWAAKAAGAALRLMGRSASYMPGVIALKLSKDFLKCISPPKTVIAVTGTNGKTTTSNLLTEILRANGFSVTNNSLGSNVQAGIACALLTDSTLTGRAKREIAVLEVDERSSVLVYGAVKPDFLICGNLMRDSVERNAHTEFISFIINSALPEKTRLILNADDIIASALGSADAEKIYFGIDALKPDAQRRSEICDIVYCPKCGGRLESEYIRYNHIGRLFCPECGYKNPTPDYLVTDIDAQAGFFTVEHKGEKHSLRLINDNIVNVYNFCGIAALLFEMGFDYEQIAAGFEKSELVSFRYKQLTGNGITVTLQAGKGRNPIAVSRSLDYVSRAQGSRKCIITNIDDDEENINDYENICWLYDSDYSPLSDASVEKVIFAGPISREHRLRALLAGVEDEKISVCGDVFTAAREAAAGGFKNIYLIFEVYRTEESAEAARLILEENSGGDTK